jgi:hypothetical protein
MNCMTEAQAKVLEKAVADWEALTRTKLGEGKQTLLTYGTVDKVKEALALDPSGMTALKILRAQTEEYAQQVGYTIQEMADNPEEVLGRVKAFNSLRKAIQSLPYVDVHSQFNLRVREALKAYDCLTPTVNTLLKNESEMAYVQRDALRAIEELREDVFFKGALTTTPCKFNPALYLFWDINSLLRILGNSKESGITLCLIQDTDQAEASHFGFAIKQGSNLILVSDKPRFDNPEQAHQQASRGGSRELGRRAERLRFPYQQFGTNINYKGQATTQLPGINTPAPIQKEAIKLADINSLPADSTIWLVMVFDLLREKYWKKASQITDKPLSYTGDMIEQPLALADSLSQALTVVDYKPLQFSPFTATEDVLTDKVEFKVTKTRQNEWMEQLYHKQVPVELLNPLPDHNPVLPKHLLTLPKDAGFYTESLHKQYLERLETYKLRKTYWGSPTELKHTHTWVARKNFAQTIEIAAKADFQKKASEVQAWYKDRVLKNREFWLEGLLQGRLELPSLPKESQGTWHIGTRTTQRVQKNALNFHMRGDEGRPNHYMNDAFGKALFLFGGWADKNHNTPLCYFQPKAAHEMAYIFPDCPEAIAALAGCKVEELPIYLQHWYSHELYHGNNILTDVDPLETVENPWLSGFSPRIYIRFARSSVKALMKSRGMKIHNPWDTAKV